LKTFCGTIDYIAPEILEGREYDMRCDYWSTGVMAYNILSGSLPFLAADELGKQRNILTGNYGYEADVWKNVSKDAKNWINNLLEYNPKKRMTPNEALEHKWLSGKDAAK